MAAIQELVGSIRIDSSGVNKGVNEAQSGLDNLGSKAQQVGSRMQGAGKAMTMGVTAPLVAMGATAVSQAATFEGAMQQSIAIMGDVSAAERKDLEQTAREVAKSTTHSHESAAESYYYLASAGMDATESIAAMPQVAAYAEAAQLDMATATDYSTDIMSAFGYEASELATVTDVLTQAVSNHNTTAEGMGEAMSYVAPVANSLGISIEETAAAIGMFSDVGIKGSKAGTSLRGVLASLADPTAKQAALLKELGVNTTDAQGNMLPLVDIVEQLEESGADTADVMALFGREAGPAMAALLQEGSGALRENTKALEEAEGATQSVADTQRDTLLGSIQILKSNLADLAIQFGSEMTPAIRVAADAVSGIAKVFGAIPSPMRKMIIAVAAIVAAIGPLLLIFGTILTMVPSMIAGWATLTAAWGAVSAVLAGGLIPALTAAAGTIAGVLAPAIGILLGPIGIALGAILLLAAAWKTNFGGIREQTMRVVRVLQEEFGPAIEWLRSVATKIFDALGFSGSGAFSKLSQAAVPLITILANGLIAIIRVLGFVGRTVFAGLSAVFSAFSTVATTAINAVRTVVQPFVVWLQTMWAAHGAAIAQEWEITWNAIQQKVTGATAAIRAVISSFVAFVRPIVSALMSFAQSQFQAGLARIRQFWSVWGDDIMAVVNQVQQTVKSLIVIWMDFIRTVVTVALRAIRGDWTGAWNAIQQYATRTTNRVRHVIAGWVNVLTGLFDKMRSRALSRVRSMVNGLVSLITGGRSRFSRAGRGLITSFTNAIKRAASGPIRAVRSIVRRIRRLLPGSDADEGPLSDLSETGPGLVETFAQGIESNADRAGRAAEKVAEAARAPLEEDGSIAKYVASISENYGWGRGGGRGAEDIPRGADPSVQLEARDLLRNVGGMSDEFVDSLTHAQAVFEAMTRGLMDVPEHFKKHINSLTPDWFSDEEERRSRLGDLSGGGGAKKVIEDAVPTLQDIVNKHGESDAAAMEEALSYLDDTDIYRLADDLKNSKWIEGDMWSDGFENAKGLIEDAIKNGISQNLYDALVSQGGGYDALGDILRMKTEGPEKGMIRAEDGTWVDPSFYNRTAGPQSTGGRENPEEVGRIVAHAVQEALAGTELDLDTNGDELVERATLKVNQERKRNVRKSARTTR